MTIYTPSQAEKDKDVLVPEVVTEPLTAFKDDQDEEQPPKVVRVTVFPHRRRSFLIHMLLTIMVLVTLACGAIGAVMFYRHVHKKQVYAGRCGTMLYDTTYHQSDLASPEPLAQVNKQHQGWDFVEEKIFVSEVDKYEELITPQFDEIRESFIFHDFKTNFTTIVEHKLSKCFVMKLNRTAIAQPTDVIDLLDKLLSGYRMPHAVVLRENYRAVLPSVTNLQAFGPEISLACTQYETFRLEKQVSGVFKRSADEQYKDFEELAYAFMSNKIDHQTVHKIFIRSPLQME